MHVKHIHVGVIAQMFMSIVNAYFLIVHGNATCNFIVCLTQKTTLNKLLVVTVRIPPRSLDMSIIEISFETGVGVRVEEHEGMLAVHVSLPHTYKEAVMFVFTTNF